MSNSFLAAMALMVAVGFAGCAAVTQVREADAAAYAKPSAAQSPR